jgi:hypothetical protein
MSFSLLWYGVLVPSYYNGIHETFSAFQTSTQLHSTQAQPPLSSTLRKHSLHSALLDANHTISRINHELI